MPIIPALTTDAVFPVNCIKNKITIIRLTCPNLFLFIILFIKLISKIIYEKCAPEIARIWLRLASLNSCITFFSKLVLSPIVKAEIRLTFSSDKLFL